MSDYQFVVYEELDEARIVRVMLNRARCRGTRRAAACSSS